MAVATEKHHQHTNLKKLEEKKENFDGRKKDGGSSTTISLLHLLLLSFFLAEHSRELSSEILVVLGQKVASFSGLPPSSFDCFQYEK